MKKNIFDKMSDSYEDFHFKDTELHVGNDTLYISPRLKLILGWSILILCCIIAYAVMGNPFAAKKNKGVEQDKRQEIIEKEVDVEEEHDTMMPYAKDDNEDLNNFIYAYFNAITDCDNILLQDMVTDSSVYSSDQNLKKKAEYITGYSNMTVYTKDGPDEGSYVAFVVSNLTINGVNSSPYDIVTLYIVTGAQGFRIVNSQLPEETENYIAKVKGDKDIQKVFQSVEKENKKLVEKDSTLKDFYEIISRRNVETISGAEQADDQSTGNETDGENQTDNQPADDGTDGGNQTDNQPADDGAGEVDQYAE